MAAKRGGQGPRRPIKGFRPGKAPPQLKRKQAKAELGKDASWAQKQTVEAIAGRSATEVRTLVRRWSLGLGAAGLALAIAGVFLYSGVWVAGALVHVVALVLLFLAYRVRKQGPSLEQMADNLR